ncbi:hypothetical protein LWI29_025561 [Acer saccharum]|uniref:Uncharacterized protein n=1 Tax=Acer saccharum TaxID=4024 RepID=A0AA39S952_ACESA|nr:hypothetical protein LWI29_025561 [Acer saccharum]
MTSSSKLPASAQGVPPPSLPTSSGSRSASSYLPGSQKEDSAVSSQSIKKKKRNRAIHQFSSSIKFQKVDTALFHLNLRLSESFVLKVLKYSHRNGADVLYCLKLFNFD